MLLFSIIVMAQHFKSDFKKTGEYMLQYKINQQSNNKFRTVLVILLIIALSSCIIEISMKNSPNASNLNFTDRNSKTLNSLPKDTASIGQSRLKTDYVAKAPIYIGGVQNIIDLGFPGDGSAAFPYVISGISIEWTSGPLITIVNINVHVLITNNFLNGTATTYHGILVQDSSNITITNNIISVQETASAAEGSAITITGDSYDILADGNTILSSDHGVTIQSLSGSVTGPAYNTISNNTFTDITGNGISVFCLTNNLILHDNTLVNNTFTNVLKGISFSPSVSSGGASNSIVKNNVMIDNGYGIELQANSYDYQYPNINRNITLINNTIIRPSYAGISISKHSFDNIINNTITDGQDVGLYITSSINNTISGNTIFKNQYDGIKLYYLHTGNNTIRNNIIANNSLNTYYYGINIDSNSHGDTVINNTIANNTGFGISVLTRAAPFSYFSRNDLIDNHGGTSQADSRASNIFEYNYWSDWISPDVDNNGIVDSPYVISATYSVEDLFPLTHRNNGGTFVVNPPDPPQIEHPMDIESEYASHTILSWSANSTAPDTYSLYRNGTLVETGNWDGSDRTVDLYALSLGYYNFTIVLLDSYSQMTVDVVIVHIIDTVLPTIYGPSNIIAQISQNVVLQWAAYDTHPGTYDILENGSIVENGMWAPEVNITYTFSSPIVGTYNLTIVVLDTSENMMSYSVVISVQKSPDPTTPQESVSSSVPKTANPSTTSLPTQSVEPSQSAQLTSSSGNNKVPMLSLLTIFTLVVTISLFSRTRYNR